MAHGFEGLKVALARLVEHFAPLVAIGHIKVFVQANGRGLGGAVDSVGQFIALKHLLAAGLEDTGTGKKRVEQVF